MSTSNWTFPTMSDDLVHTNTAQDSQALVSEADNDHAKVLAAIASGAVPTFDHNPATDPDKAPNPIDADAEAAAFRELVAAIRQSAEPGTTITLMDADAFANGLT